MERNGPSRKVESDVETNRFMAHRKKVHNMSAQIDNKEPPVYPHIHLKLKKLQLEHDRLSKVDGENKRLLNSLLTIGQSRSNIDNYNPYEHKSMNDMKRKEKSIVTVTENEHLVRRIIRSRSSYDKRSLDKEWTERQAIINRISRQSHFSKNPKPSKTQRSKSEPGREESVLF